MVKRSQTQQAEGERRFTDDANAIDTVVGTQSRFEGRLSGKTNVRISGSYEGEIDVSGLVWLGPGGTFTGDLRAGDAVFEGEASGTFTIERKIDIRVTASVEGEIVSEGIAMAEGSHFAGTVTMTGGKSEADVVRYEEKRSLDPPQKKA